jgi:hypothetical protein
MTTEQDAVELLLLQDRCDAIIRGYDQMKADLAAANERIARLERVAQAAARFRDDATGSQESLNALWDSLDAADPAGDTP